MEERGGLMNGEDFLGDLFKINFLEIIIKVSLRFNGEGCWVIMI